MKRLIKYYNRYKSDNHGFSDCGTRYEVLPELVDDNAGHEELKVLAKKHGIKLGRKLLGEQGNVTHAINTMEVHKQSDHHFNPKIEELTVYLGFIELNSRGPLKPVVEPNTPVTPEMAYEVINHCAYGVQDVGETVDKKQCLIKDGWNYESDMALLGYDRESFEKVLNIEDIGFHDDTSRCGHCNLMNSNDNGYTNNFRVVDCELIGVECGCYDEYCQSDEALEAFSNEASNTMERETAKKLEENGKLKELETFIGGMVDGRGGYIRGKSTREGTPAKVLEEYLEKNPNKVYIFTHDESGQFQTYFSIWEVIQEKKRTAKR